MNRELRGNPRAPATRRRRSVAVIGAVGLHLLFALLFLAPGPHGLSAGGAGGVPDGGAGEGIAIDLSTLSGSLKQADSIRSQPEETFRPAQSLDVSALASADVNDLTSPPVVMPVIAVGSPQRDDDAGPGSQATTAGDEGGRSGQDNGAGDDLWAAIAPCWSRLATRDATPVQLTVSFAPNGMLLSAPQISRDPGAVIDVKTQKSEAEAIQALSECSGYVMAAGRTDVKISFPKP